MAVLPSQTRGKLNKPKCPHQYTGKTIVHDRAQITHEREAQTGEITSTMYGQVHCACPLFHHKLKGSSTNRNVLTNVRASLSCMAVLSLKSNKEFKRTKGPSHQCLGKSIEHRRDFITNERESQSDERSSSMYGQVYCACPCFHHKRERGSTKQMFSPVYK